MVVIGLQAVALNAAGGCQFATYLFSGSVSADPLNRYVGSWGSLGVGSWKLSLRVDASRGARLFLDLLEDLRGRYPRGRVRRELIRAWTQHGREAFGDKRTVAAAGFRA